MLARLCCKTGTHGEKIHESLINNEMPVIQPQSFKVGWSDKAPVRIVGINNHRDIEPLQFGDGLQRRNTHPCLFPRYGMSAVGWPKNTDAAGGQNLRQALDQALCAWNSDDAGWRTRTIGLRRYLFE